MAHRAPASTVDDAPVVRRRPWWRGLRVYVGVAIILVWGLAPFYWMLVTAFRAPDYTFDTTPWPTHLTLENFRNALSTENGNNFPRALTNSLIIGGATTLIAVVLGTPAAYALSRFQFRGKKDLWFWFISNRMISPIVLALPVYLLARSVDMLDTHWVLILIYLSFCLPIVVWICTDQFRSIPPDIEQAARLDHANQWDIFWRIYLPLGLPGVAVSAIFSFIFSWNELLYALVLTQSKVHTAPVIATSYMSGYELPWGKIMATGTVIVLPVTLFALVVSRHMVRGLTMGASK